VQPLLHLQERSGLERQQQVSFAEIPSTSTRPGKDWGPLDAMNCEAGSLAQSNDFSGFAVDYRFDDLDLRDMAR